MMIRAESQKADIMSAVQGSVKTVKAVRRNKDSSNGDYEAMAARRNTAGVLTACTCRDSLPHFSTWT